MQEAIQMLPMVLQASVDTCLKLIKSWWLQRIAFESLWKVWKMKQSSVVELWIQAIVQQKLGF